MSWRGSYRELTKRADELERLVHAVVPAGPGCVRCSGWPDLCVVAGAETEGDASWLRDVPWYCLARSRPDGQPCPGCWECLPRSGWPEDFTCRSCSRVPEMVVRIEYADWPPADEPGDAGREEEDDGDQGL